MPVYNLRFSPAHEKRKEIVDSDMLSPIRQVRRRHGHNKYSAYDFDPKKILNDPKDPWLDPEAEGRSSLYHVGPHSVFWMQWMFGLPESVVSLGDTRAGGLPVEDNNVAAFRYENGMLVTRHTSETEPKAPLATEIYGFEGSLIQVRSDPPLPSSDFGETATLMIQTKDTEEWQPLTEFDRRLVSPGYNPFEKFFEVLSTGDEMPITMYDERECVRILAVAKLAGKEKHQVELSEITG